MIIIFFIKRQFFEGGSIFSTTKNVTKIAKKKIDKNTPINKMIDYLEENEENLKLYDDERKKKYFDGKIK